MESVRHSLRNENARKWGTLEIPAVQDNQLALFLSFVEQESEHPTVIPSDFSVSGWLGRILVPVPDYPVIPGRQTVSDDSVSVPKSAFADLDLRDGDFIEGRASSDSVEVRIVRRGVEPIKGMTAARFVEKWRGQFPDVERGTDPRLAALLEKHVKPA